MNGFIHPTQLLLCSYLRNKETLDCKCVGKVFSISMLIPFQRHLVCVE